MQQGAIDADLACDSQARLMALPAPETPDRAGKPTPAALNVAHAYRAFSEPPGDGRLPYADAQAALDLHQLLDRVGATQE